MKVRPERVAHLIQREVAELIERRLRDPRLTRWVSVTDVEVTPDLSLARVYVSVHPDSDEAERTLQALHHAAGFIRRELAPRLGLREVPEIRFEMDESLARGARVEELLRKIQSGEPIPEEDDE